MKLTTIGLFGLAILALAPSAFAGDVYHNRETRESAPGFQPVSDTRYDDRGARGGYDGRDTHERRHWWSRHDKRNDYRSNRGYDSRNDRHQSNRHHYRNDDRRYRNDRDHRDDDNRRYN